MKAENRISNTKNAFLHAYAAVAKTKPAEKITVADLCRAADISRNTFYSHYKDMADFLAWAEDAAISLHLSAFQDYQYDTNIASSFEAQLDSLLEHADIIFSVLDRNGGAGMARLKRISYERVAPHWIEESTLSDEQMQLLCAYVFDGSIAFMRKWWQSNFAIDKSTAKELLENLFKYGAYNYIYTV